MKKIMIIGAGEGGTALLRMLVEAETMQVVAVSDIDPQAPGLDEARRLGIETSTDWRTLLSDRVDVVIEATGDEHVLAEINQRCSERTAVIPGQVASLIFNLIAEKEALIGKLEQHYNIHDIILNSTHDGMIAINEQRRITLVNAAAERMTGLKAADVINKDIHDVMPSSLLPNVLHTGVEETNREQVLENGRKIVTTRVQMKDDDRLIGALAVFKDITEIVQMAEQVTNLKSIQTMLEAIINSSDEAISVVDEHGKGLMINPAYTRLTGLSPEEVIGKPATADIYEGESMHMHVLKTRKPVRGVRLKVGPKRRDVVVNVAPVIVDGQLKGSVGVIHDVSEIKSLTDELERARRIIRTLEAKYSFDDIIGESEEMKLAIEQAKIGASTPATVLLRGESGTGKELFAHAIHNESDRKYKKFIRVNCAAISDSLLESELFGYEEGAFSGAKRGGKRGLFEEANNGSIFLDEIGELSSSTQAKLLRVLQEKEIVRVGGTKAIPIDVRVIAATNVNLEKGINENTFREDLYYRLNKMPIQIPSLRDRKGDLCHLGKHLVSKINQDYGRNVEGITQEALTHLQSYHWPGNVRELENVLGRAIIYMKQTERNIDVHHIPPLDIEAQVVVKQEQATASDYSSLAEMVEQFEKDKIIEALQAHKGNKTATAKSLKLSIRNLYYKLGKYNIEKHGMQ
ncbi:sigma 54-interacting transcriptional regulator [Desertibacillus haloalkaliphilus]|uniref:sigma 54-interacting transcriptional regulator n=1 Tax=Desertibacillus haloalkaliphilus TaxID=1328930 RepID=UPI001C260CB4|nr:sigma 54-interacting transcriptional regulator [Desertibacillus haloalkaliphilus]MBU8907750.1 sigma 54-interacting transcriptional regulator [Desertibacillus haloalkaliphilus]